MYKELSVFEAPPPSAKVWRYMDFTKFVSLLSKKALFFCRMDKHQADNWEGALPKNQYNALLSGFRESQSAVIRTLSDNRERASSAGMEDDAKYFEKLISEEQTRQEQSPEFKKFFFWQRYAAAICCWHKNERESAAMWKLFLSSPEGVAISTTFQALADSFKETQEDVFIGKVKYYDHLADRIPLDHPLRPLIHKRKSYEHEREIRILIYRFKNKDILENEDENKHPSPWGTLGDYINVDVNKVMETVHVAPKSPDWFRDLVSDVLREYGYERKVNESSLDEESIY